MLDDYCGFSYRTEYLHYSPWNVNEYHLNRLCLWVSHGTSLCSPIKPTPELLHSDIQQVGPVFISHECAELWLSPELPRAQWRDALPPACWPFPRCPLYFSPSDSFGAKCSIIFNLCCAHLLPQPINPCRPQRQMEAGDCTLSSSLVEFLSPIKRTWPEVYSGRLKRPAQCSVHRRATSRQDFWQNSCSSHRKITHWLSAINKPGTATEYFKTLVQE